MKIFVDKVQSGGPKIGVVGDDGVVLLNQYIELLPERDDVLLFGVPGVNVIALPNDYKKRRTPHNKAKAEPFKRSKIY